MWEYWLMEDHTGRQVFTPIEFQDDDEGTFDVVLGFALSSSLKEMQQRARKIWRVSDVYDPSDLELVWERTA